jgi:hypothetical protein
MSDTLRPGDRVLDLRAVARSGSLFAAIVAAAVATGLSGWWWASCLLASVVAATAGWASAGIVGRAVFPAPSDQSVIVRVGLHSVGVALRASTAGAIPIVLACSLAALLSAGGVVAVVALLIGFGTSAAVGCLAALV